MSTATQNDQTRAPQTVKLTRKDIKRVHRTEEACRKECGKLEKGPRFPWKVTVKQPIQPGDYYVVASSWDNAFGALGFETGAHAEAIDQKPRVKREVTLDSLEQLIQSSAAISDEAKKALEAALAKAKAKK